MKKNKVAIIIPLASGYFNKVEELAKKYNIDCDLSMLKPNEKIEKAKKYKDIICIGSQYVLNNQVIQPSNLYEILEDYKPKKEKDQEDNIT